MKFKTLALLAALFTGAIAHAATPLFTEDFEWLEPWSSLTPAGQTVETSNPDATAQQLGTNKVDGISTYEALLAKGYSFPICCASNKSPRQPQAQTYLQRNYLKFGLTGYYSGFSFPIDGTKADANTDYTLSFKWCPMATATGNFDATKLVVIMSDASGDKTFEVPEHTLENGKPYAWIPVNVNLGKITDANTRITVRNIDAQWPDENAKAYRWFIDDINVDAAAEITVTITPDPAEIPVGGSIELEANINLNSGVEAYWGEWTLADNSIAEFNGGSMGWGGTPVRQTITGKKAGSTTITYATTLSNGAKISATAAINVVFGIGSTFEVDNITYEVTGDNTAAIKDARAAEGEITLKNTVTYNGTNYTVNKILGNAFRDSKITAVTIPNGIEMEARAFYCAYSLKKVVLPSELKSIEDRTFYNCNVLTEINFPAGLEKIGQYAFYRTFLASVSLPESLTTIGDKAFIEIYPLKSISIGKNVSSIGERALGTCTNLVDIKVAADNQWYTAEDGMLLTADRTSLIAYAAGRDVSTFTIPATITTFGNNVFAYAKFQTLIFPEGISEVPQVCYYNNNLETIKLPSTTTKVDCQFIGCDQLKNIYLGAAVPPELGASTFQPHSLNGEDLKTWYTVYVPKGCVDAYKASAWRQITENIFDDENHVTNFSIDGISYIVVSDGIVAISNGKNATGDVKINLSVNYNGTDYLVKSIMDRAFANNTEIKSISLPASIDELGMQVFLCCLNLEKVVLPAGLKSIPANSFTFCEKLTDINMPAALQEIDYQAFSESGLSAIALPEKLTTINDYAFFNCKNLSSISFGKNVSSIGASILNSCTALKEISVAADNQWYTAEDNLLLTADKSTLVVYPLGKDDSTFIVPENIRTFANGVFSGAKFNAIMFPEGITSIPQGVCYDCTELETVKLPSTTTEIQSSAFGSSLKNIISMATVPPTFNWSFATHYDNNNNVDKSWYTVFVPKGCVDAYKASAWGELTDNITDNESGVENVIVESTDAEPVIYDLYGRRIANPVPGHIYIINGKKVLMK